MTGSWKSMILVLPFFHVFKVSIIERGKNPSKKTKNPANIGYLMLHSGEENAENQRGRGSCLDSPSKHLSAGARIPLGLSDSQGRGFTLSQVSSQSSLPKCLGASLPLCSDRQPR